MERHPIRPNETPDLGNATFGPIKETTYHFYGNGTKRQKIGEVFSMDA